MPFVKNAGFEEYPIETWPGYGRVSSWNSTGTGPGTNGAGGPFLNGLPIPGGQNVGFIQGGGTLRAIAP